jgi:hypothetical protein
MEQPKKKQMKVIFKSETKKFALIADYDTLEAKIKKSFKVGQSGDAYKFFYIDETQDVITVDCQDDLDEFLNEF